MPTKRLPRPSQETLNYIVNLYKDQYNDQLEEALTRFYEEQKMSGPMYRRRQMYIKMITDYLKSEGIISQLESNGIEIHDVTAFGSFPTHCATKESDIDLCVCASTSLKGIPPVCVLECIHRDLKFNPDSRAYFGEFKIRDLTFVKTAKVPIIRFTIDEVPVDLSSNFDGLPPRTSLAAKYINGYCQLDDRFTILVTFIKSWMRPEGSSADHLRDFPNSYSLILLLIHVLQWYNVFPNLHETHPDIFNLKNFVDWKLVKINKLEFKNPLDENAVVNHKMNPLRKLSVAQLLHLFAFHYSNEPYIDNCRFNMKSGQIEERKSPEHAFQIIDPYDKMNPARSARTSHEFIGALRDFRRAVTFPNPNMFKTVMRITREKTYLSPHPEFLFMTKPRISNGLYFPPQMIESADDSIPGPTVQQIYQQYPNHYPTLAARESSAGEFRNRGPQQNQRFTRSSWNHH